jgi:linear primary-alkylsulfatase
MGWYDGNPSSLNDLPPEPAAKKYVEYMGGAKKIIKRARKDFDNGEYRWLAMALKHVVFADPDNQEAKNLLADTYEQLGYQAEAGTWRSIYLQGAYELRNGTPDIEVSSTASADTISAMSPEMLFDYLSVKLNGERAVGKKIVLNMDFTDLDTTYGLIVENAVLNYRDTAFNDADATLTLTKAGLNQVQLGQKTMKEMIDSGKFEIEGDKAAFEEFFGLLDNFELWFNIVTP